MIPWLKENYGAEIITYTGNLGQGEDLEAVRAIALRTGAAHAVVDDLQERFVNEFIWPSVRASALYEGSYPLHTALGRPLLAQRLVEVALEHGADAISHGCTGKGNDQVRFELGYQALDADLEIFAPWKNTDFINEFSAGRHRVLVDLRVAGDEMRLLAVVLHACFTHAVVVQVGHDLGL